MKVSFTCWIVGILFPIVINAQQVSRASHLNKLTKEISKDEYFEKTVILKFPEKYRNQCFADGVSILAFDDLSDLIKLNNIRRKFPHAKQPLSEKDKFGFKYADLTLIYEFTYEEDYDVFQVINKLYKLGIVVYAQPHYRYKISYNPSDTEIVNQTHLGVINAYSGWDVSKGDTNVVIGIIDSGWDNDHPDLKNELKHNYDDPINGIDDDSDGYTDNYNGWDFVGNDNNPQASVSADHGVHVSGCASPSTDNGIGIAGPGFNTKLLPVKAGSGNTVDYGYEGITYAADQGVDIINCSWGSSFGGPLGQDVIDYATINKNALVIAAAGNDGINGEHYPSSYEYVISVAATELNDTKSGYSNYGIDIDVCAPGRVYSTVDGGGYNWNQGTSMASPVAAGVAAMIKSVGGNGLTALQLGAQLKATCDDINSQNPSFINLLGAGRVNLETAVGSITKPGIEMFEKTATDKGDDAFVIGDTIHVSGIYRNFLAPSGNLIATISTTSPYINIIDDNVSLGVIGWMDETDNHSDPFILEVLAGAPLNTPVLLQIDITDGNYSWVEFMEITVNVDYINIAINDVAATVTSKGLIGYNQESQEEGIGFTYLQGESILWDAALMVGVNGKVVDMARDAGTGTGADFGSVQNVYQLSTPEFSEFDVQGIFNDTNAPTADRLNIEVGHKGFAWTTQGHRKYIILEYTIRNTGTSMLDDLYAGIYADFDISNAEQNKAATEPTKQLGYCYDINLDGLYAGIQLVSSHDFNHYAVFNNGVDGNSVIHPNDSYTSAEKYTTLSTANADAGGPGGADVSNIVSAGPYDLAAGDSVVVAFALIAGDNLFDLNRSADSAYIQYNGEPLIISGGEDLERANYFEVYPNPAKDFAHLSFTLNEASNVKIGLYDMTGKKVKTFINHGIAKGSFNTTIDLSEINNGIYFIELNLDGEQLVKKISIN